MTNSRASSKLVKLYDHIATGTEASDTYTPATPLNLTTQYSRIFVYITGETTLAQSLLLTLNSMSTTQNSYDYIQNLNGTVTGVSTDATSSILVHPIALSGTAFGFQSSISIWTKVDDTPNHNLQCSWHSAGDNVGSSHGSANTSTATSETIITIKLASSTSTWKSGTHISIYGLRI